MHSTLFIAALSSLALVHAQAPTPVPGTTGELGPAEEVGGNPPGVTYQAILPDSKKSTIRGYVAGTSAPDGNGVQFNINIFGLPDSSLGPFQYHIHDQPVPTDGNCTGTKAHLDPYIRGQKIPCDSKDPASCEVGDLAGKHGNITRNPFQITFLDPYLSTEKGPASFFGNRSIVIHANNSTRLTCANFTLVGGTAGNGTAGNGTVGHSTGGNGSVIPNNTLGGGASPAQSGSYEGGAVQMMVSTGAILAGLAAFML